MNLAPDGWPSQLDEFGAAVLSARQRLGMERPDLAQRAGVRTLDVSNTESGHCPGPRVRAAILGVLGALSTHATAPAGPVLWSTDGREFGRQVQRWRATHSMTPGTLARLAGTTRWSVKRAEAGVAGQTTRSLLITAMDRQRS